MKLPSHLENRLKLGTKLVSPSSERNSGPIGEQLVSLLPQNARVLEIASGTGQHGAYMCGLRRDITWQYSDIDAQSLVSQAAYAADHPQQIMPPLRIDVTQENWGQDLSGYDAIYCANMIHIAPWDAALGLAKGAGGLLHDGQKLFLYGPFLLGATSAASNINFDQNLKNRNPDWGVRTLESVKHMFADEGLEFQAAMEMPRDNFLLVFKRTH